ncbi:MAG: hypothetical protein HY541_08300 [Deltaproteobacteria bacterium]|nr:hypothetical protein [Deltaproteobacteria bacterium]
MKPKYKMKKNCLTCKSIGKTETGYSKYGWEEDATKLPPAVGSLSEIASDVSGGHGDTLYQCPECGAYFHYNLNYEYFACGTEDSETLSRISDEEAATLKQQIKKNR